MAFARFPLLLLVKSSMPVGCTGSRKTLYDITMVVVVAVVVPGESSKCTAVTVRICSRLNSLLGSSDLQ